MRIQFDHDPFDPPAEQLPAFELLAFDGATATEVACPEGRRCPLTKTAGRNYSSVHADAARRQQSKEELRPAPSRQSRLLAIAPQSSSSPQ